MADSFGPGMDLPPELMPQALSIRRKQKMAEALMRKGEQVPQGFMAGRVYIPTTGLGALNSAAATGVGTWAGMKTDDETADLGKEYNNLLGKEVERYLKSSQPQPGIEGNVEEGQQPRDVTKPPVGANERITRAMTSGFAPIRQMGQMELQASLKGQLTPEKWAEISKWAKPESVRAALMTGDLSKLEPRQEWTGSGGFALGKHGETPEARPITQYSPLTEIPGGRGVMVSTEAGTNKPIFGPSTTNVTQVNTPENKAQLAVTNSRLNLDEKALLASREGAQAAANDLQIVIKAHGFLEQGVKAGMFRDAKTAVNQMLGEMGLTATDNQVENTRLFVATMQDRVLKNSRALGSGTAFSNTDRTFLEQMLSGKDMPVGGLYQLLSHVGVDSARVVNHHNELIGRAAKEPGTPATWESMHRINVPEFKLHEGPPGSVPPKPVGKLRPL